MMEMGLPILAYSPEVQILTCRSFRALASGASRWVVMRLRPPCGRVHLLCKQKTDMARSPTHHANGVFFDLLDVSQAPIGAWRADRPDAS
jgi:hypothetical protein